VIPGVINLSHGGNTTTFIDATFLILLAQSHDPVKHTAVWPLPIPGDWPAVTLYFQAVMIDPTNIDRRPIVVSTLDRTAIHL